MALQENDFEKPSPKGKNYAISALITIGICSLPLGIALICWSSVSGYLKSQPQISGNNEDHFRAHVINPIPQSVVIQDVYFDDIIIHPDVSYYFRFFIDRNDLNKIISYRALSPKEGTCSETLTTLKWWDVEKFDGIEKYVYEEGKYGNLLITLCYHAASKTAYYLYFTY